MRFHIHNRFSLHENRFFTRELDDLPIEYEIIPDGIDMSYRTHREQLTKWIDLLKVSWGKSGQSLSSSPPPDVVTFNTPIEAVVFGVRRFLKKEKPLSILTTMIVAQKGSSFSNWLRRVYYELVLRGVDVAVCHTQNELMAYRALFPKFAQRLIYLPYGFANDDHEIEAQEIYDLPDQPFLFSGGRSGRDYATLIEAVRDLEIPVYIACDSEQYLPEKAYSDHIHILRDCTGEAFKAMIAAAQLVVVPLAPASHSAGQMVVLGAFANGVPVITSDIPAIRDYVDQGRAARLVPAESSGTLRTEIVKLWGDNLALEQLAIKGYEHFEAKLTRRAFWYNLVERVLKK